MNNINFKANKMNNYDMDSYDANDSYYYLATDLAAFMGHQTDMDELQHTLQCSRAMQEGKPKPNLKLRRERQPIRPDLQIKGTAWTDISPELRSAWIHKTSESKEKVIAQFKVPVTKNRQLTAYEADI